MPSEKATTAAQEVGNRQAAAGISCVRFCIDMAGFTASPPCFSLSVAGFSASNAGGQRRQVHGCLLRVRHRQPAQRIRLLHGHGVRIRLPCIHCRRPAAGVTASTSSFVVLVLPVPSVCAGLCSGELWVDGPMEY